MYVHGKVHKVMNIVLIYRWKTHTGLHISRY